jgi:cytochrome P450
MSDDFEEARASGLAPRLNERLTDGLPFLYSVLRNVRPNVRLLGAVQVTRRDDVEAVLDDVQGFQVRSGVRLAELQERAKVKPPPPLFGLGDETDEIYDPTQAAMSAAVRPSDVDRLAKIARDFVEPQAASGARFDLGRLALLTPMHVARSYFGLQVADGDMYEMALCCLALVGYCFGPDRLDTVPGRLGSKAAGKVANMLRASITQGPPCSGGDTVISRLLHLHPWGSQPEDKVPYLLAALTVLLMAQVGAPAVATVNVARVLLARRSAMEAATARADDDVALGRCLMEALRFKPIFPGALRDCRQDRVIAEGTSRRLAVRRGETVLPATMSAMFDKRRVTAPGRFIPDRSPPDPMVFGFGRHSCLGFALGRTLLVETLKPLLRRGLRQTFADRSAISYFGSFQEHFPVRLG